uniref:Non-SMC condensin II complex subunit G2 n=1 Tax=Rhinopithecus roxellana TaxID=61622 RepID=A0A2K6PWG7_RHIRO
MEKRQTFVQAVSKELVGEFLQFVQLDKEASDPFSLNELLDELSRKQKEELWQRLKNLLTDVLLESPVDGWQVVEAQGEDNMETEHGSKMRKSIEIIYAITSVILASVSVINERENYEALLECVIILNGILYALPESERKLQSSIQDLCVTWWEKGLPAKEDTGKTAFVMLLRRSLETKTGADVCRLWRVHQALYCFDYDLEESGEIKDMLLECFININYIKKEEGRRFLSSLFNWNINFIRMIHGTIKNQLQGLQKSLMVYIAEIYFRAWKKASGKILETIENDCIQDFMFHGIHLPRRSPVHSKVREVLSYFHHQKKVRQGVEEMLYRLYKPILWRGLKARNSEVRSNAALLFVEAFPIRDPNLHAIEMDSEIQKQFEELYSLLEDPYPMVRSTGILGVCKITSKYWEMMPPTILIDLLKKVTGELAFDTSSADVRCSVFKVRFFKLLGHILELVDNWLPTEHAQAKSNTASKRRVQIHDTRPVKPELALVYIEYLLTHPKNRECLLSAPRKKLNHLLKALETSKADLESLLQTPGGKPRGFGEAAALRAFGLHCRLSIHLQHKFCSEGKVYLSILEDTGFWLESKILSFIQDQEEEYLKLHRVIYQQIIQTYLTVCKDVVMVGLGDHQFQMQLLQRSLGIMQTVKGFFYVSLLLDILKEITGSSLIQKTDSDEEVAMLLDTVQKVFQKMLECIARSFKKQPEEGLRLLYSVQRPLHEFITAVQSWHTDTPVHRGVLSTLIAGPVVEISHQLRKVSDIEELTPPEHLSDLPPFSRCLIGIIIKSSNVVRSFLDELKACVASDDIEGIVCLTAAVHIILVINAGKHKSSKVREVAATVHRKLKTFMEITLEEDSCVFLSAAYTRWLGD